MIDNMHGRVYRGLHRVFSVVAAASGASGAWAESEDAEALHSKDGVGVFIIIQVIIVCLDELTLFELDCARADINFVLGHYCSSDERSSTRKQ